MKKAFTSIFSACLVTFALVCGLANAEDWPTYRYNIARSGATPEKLSTPLSLHWKFEPDHPPKPAWPMPGEEMPRTHFDSAYHVTAADGKVYFGSSVDNGVYAIDSEKGDLRWTFFTEGPVRFAPAVWQDRVYVGSDDGYVYCLQAESGELIWKYRAGPSDEKVIGNGRMISLWPVRTSVLVDDSVVYFGAGVFPYEGIYICALDASDGSVIWKNDTLGDRTHEQDFGGVSPQSYLVASEKTLYVPSGRAMPASFDRESGRFLRYLSPGSKVGGTWALVSGDELIAGVDRSGTPAKVAYDDNTGRRKGDAYAWFPGLDMVITSDVSYTLTIDGIKAIDRASYPQLTEKLNAIREDQKKLSATLTDMTAKFAAVDEKMRAGVNAQIEETTRKIDALAREAEENLKVMACKWQYDRKDLRSMILAGDVIFAGGKGIVVAVDANLGEELWSHEVDGKVYGLAAADGHLFASTDIGCIYAFGKKSASEPGIIKSEFVGAPYPDDEFTSVYEAAAEAILEETGVKKGYCLVLGAETGRLAFEIARRSELKVIGIEEEKEKAQKAKESLYAAGLYGSQAVVEQWDLASLPEYFANLIVSDELIVSGEMSYSSKNMYRVLRPYGGIACFGQPGSDILKEGKLAEWLRDSVPESEVISPNGPWVKITRGELEGAGSWTEQYADPQNTACSDDELVKSPLGVLWFGDPGPKKMVERHSKSVSPISMNGRLFVQGEEVIMACDVYNGTLFWEREIPGAVRPRADADGGNLSLTEDGLYVAAYDKCYRLDPATGETMQVYQVPDNADGSPRRWGYIACTGDLLYGTRTMPLPRDYFAFWEDGKWKDPDEIPEQLKDEYEAMKARYPDAGSEMWEIFKRSGYLWRRMANYPRWEIYLPSKGAFTERMMTSDRVFAMDPETGEMKWKHDGERISNITVTIGDGKVFFTESAVSEEQKRIALEDRQKLIEEGVYEPTTEAAEFQDLDVRTIFCLDAYTGEKIWEKTLDLTWCGGDVLGTAYHKDGILLLFANMGSHDAWRHKDGTLKWKRLTALSAEDGHVLWSKANNYRTRPFIVGDDVYIEPRVCDVHTGEIKMRTHPITGEQVPWEYLRPGHTCAITGAGANMFFYRSYCMAFYDLAEDNGLTLFGGIRPGCWISMIPASGVLLAPEGSAGCTCSFPIRCSVALKHKPERMQPWNVFITHSTTDTARHFAINLGAPGDMKDEEGNVWFAYPNPKTSYAGNHYPDYGVKFSLNEKILEGMGYFYHDSRGVEIDGTDKPWLFTSGCMGLSKCEVPLIDYTWGDEPGIYTLRLGFAALPEDQVGQRVFSVKLQGDTVLENFDIAREAGSPDKAVVKEFKGVKVGENLSIELVPGSANPGINDVPILNFIAAIREDKPAGEPSEAIKPLKEGKAESMLNTARMELENNNHEKALEAYHAVFDAAPTVELRRQALEGMAAIGSPKSLSRIALYCKDIHPVMRDYKDPDPGIKDAAIKVCIAVANNIAESDKQRAIDMLKDAMKAAGKTDTGQLVANSLENLGVAVD